jgi:hypothetical protein
MAVKLIRTPKSRGANVPLGAYSTTPKAGKTTRQESPHVYRMIGFYVTAERSHVHAVRMIKMSSTKRNARPM